MGPTWAQQDAATDKALELEQLQQRIKQLQSTLVKKRGKRDHAKSALQDAETQIGKISRSLYQLDLKVLAHRKRLEQLQQQHVVLKEKMAAQRSLLAAQVRASYSLGRQEELKILLNQGDPGTVQRSLVYYDYLNRSRADRIREASQQLQELIQVEAAIQEEYRQRQQLQAEVNIEKQALVAVRKERKQSLAELNREIHTEDGRLERMLADEEELRRILKSLDQALNDIPVEIVSSATFASRKGKLQWPSSGKLVAYFGRRRTVGNMFWNGVKISAPSGREVRAVSHGRVAFADWLRGYGMIMIIDHGDGFMSLYGNNQSLFKEAGEWAADGEVIASVGDSGGQSSSGLYFEIRQQGKPVDPLKWCQATKGDRVGMN